MKDQPGIWRMRARHAIAAWALVMIGGPLALSAQAAPRVPKIPDVATWRASIADVAQPGAGCFTAAYPSMQWTRMACGRAPKNVSVPAHGAPPPTVGNGHDYTAVVPGLISASDGSFAHANTAKTEKDSGSGYANSFTIQLNTNFIPGDPACAGAAVPSACKAWQQFYYAQQTRSPLFASISMQYWLLHYAAPCPPGWNAYADDCVTNSDTYYLTFGFPVKIKYLSDLALSARAAAGGQDKVVFLANSQAYSVAADDNIFNLSQFWHASEFNVFGSSDGSNANFNAGASIGLKLTVKDNTKDAPTCVGDSGTTGEGNNLNLGPCVTQGKSIRFTESN